MDFSDVLLLTGSVGVGTGVAGLLTGYTVGKISERQSHRIKIWQSSNKIARIYIKGMITKDDPTILEPKVEEALKDGVRGFIFDINSPGGHVAPTPRTADYIKSIQCPKVAFVQNICGSAAYWIASACDTIVAQPYSRVGSIGVISISFDISGLLEKIGVRVTRVATGPYKGMSFPFWPITLEQIAVIEHENEIVYKGFIDAVAKNRNLPYDHVKELADGRAYLGVEAQQKGLVDILGGLDEARRAVEELGGFTNGKIADYNGKKSPLKKIFASFS